MVREEDRSPLVKSRTSFYFDKRKVYKEALLVPNLISISRILLIIPICLLYADPSPIAFKWAFALLCLSYLSDYADGVVARNFNLQSALGLILDPLADKLWTIVMLVLLVLYRELPLWIALIIVTRDTIIIILNARIIRRTGIIKSSDIWGKSYMVAFGLVVIGLTLRFQPTMWLVYLLLPAALLTLANYYGRYRRLLAIYNAATFQPTTPPQS